MNTDFFNDQNTILKADLTLNQKTLHLWWAAIVKTVLRLSNLVIGENVSSKLILSHCKWHFVTNLTLYFWIELFEQYLTLQINFSPTTCLSFDRSINSHVSFLFMTLISSFIASHHSLYFTTSWKWHSSLNWMNWHLSHYHIYIYIYISLSRT